MRKRCVVRVGFTIAELLIVTVVIAILAAIAILMFIGIQNRAYDSAVELDVNTVRKKLELVKIDLGRYPNSHTEMPELRVTKSAYDAVGSNIYFCVNRVTDVYAYAVRSKSGKGYIYLSGSNMQSGVAVNETATCQATGLTGAYDPNRFTVVGYADDKFAGQWPTQYNPDLKWVK